MNVRWTETAARHLQGIYDHIAQDSPHGKQTARRRRHVDPGPALPWGPEDPPRGTLQLTVYNERSVVERLIRSACDVHFLTNLAYPLLLLFFLGVVPLATAGPGEAPSFVSLPATAAVALGTTGVLLFCGVAYLEGLRDRSELLAPIALPGSLAGALALGAGLAARNTLAVVNGPARSAGVSRDAGLTLEPSYFERLSRCLHELAASGMMNGGAMAFPKLETQNPDIGHER